MDGAPIASVASPPPAAPMAVGASVTPERTKRPRPPLRPEQRKLIARKARVRRQLGKLKDDQELEQLEAKLREMTSAASPPPKAQAPTAPPKLEALQGGASADAPAPVAAQPRPGWPSDEAIAESTAMAELVVTIAQGVLAKTAYGPGLSESVEISVRRPDGSRVTQKLLLRDALVERLAPVLAKYGAKLADSPEMQLAIVAAPWLLKPLAEKYLGPLMAQLMAEAPEAKAAAA
jgi:hypothetical protein